MILFLQTNQVRNRTMSCRKSSQITTLPSRHQKCYCCGNPGHTAQSCKFKTAKCRRCGKLDHIWHVCRSELVAKSPHPVRSVHEDEDYSLLKVHGRNDKAPPIMIEMDINGQVVKTGARYQSNLLIGV